MKLIEIHPKRVRLKATLPEGQSEVGSAPLIRLSPALRTVPTTPPHAHARAQTSCEPRRGAPRQTARLHLLTGLPPRGRLKRSSLTLPLEHVAGRYRIERVAFAPVRPLTAHASDLTVMRPCETPDPSADLFLPRTGKPSVEGGVNGAEGHVLPGNNRGELCERSQTLITAPRRARPDPGPVGVRPLTAKSPQRSARRIAGIPFRHGDTPCAAAHALVPGRPPAERRLSEAEPACGGAPDTELPRFTLPAPVPVARPRVGAASGRGCDCAQGRPPPQGSHAAPGRAPASPCCEGLFRHTERGRAGVLAPAPRNTTHSRTPPTPGKGYWLKHPDTPAGRGHPAHPMITKGCRRLMKPPHPTSKLHYITGAIRF